MKWYPLAHLAAVTMSCFCAELQALQLLFPNSASGIARALPSFLSYIFKFLDSWCRPLVSLSDNLNPFQRYRGRKHKLCMCMGREWPNLGRLSPRHSQRPPTYQDPFFSRPCQKKKTDTVFIINVFLGSCWSRWYCHGHSQVSSSGEDTGYSGFLWI